MFFLAWLVPSITKTNQTHAEFTISLLWPLLIREKEVEQQSESQLCPSVLLLGGDRAPSGHCRICFPLRILGNAVLPEEETSHGCPRASGWGGQGGGRESRDRGAFRITKEAPRMQEESPGCRKTPLAHMSEQTPAGRGSAEQRRMEQRRRTGTRLRQDTQQRCSRWTHGQW